MKKFVSNCYINKKLLTNLRERMIEEVAAEQEQIAARRRAMKGDEVRFFPTEDCPPNSPICLFRVENFRKLSRTLPYLIFRQAKPLNVIDEYVPRIIDQSPLSERLGPVSPALQSSLVLEKNMDDTEIQKNPPFPNKDQSPERQETSRQQQVTALPDDKSDSTVSFNSALKIEGEQSKETNSLETKTLSYDENSLMLYREEHLCVLYNPKLRARPPRNSERKTLSDKNYSDSKAILAEYIQSSLHAEQAHYDFMASPDKIRDWKSPNTGKEGYGRSKTASVSGKKKNHPLKTPQRPPSHQGFFSPMFHMPKFAIHDDAIKQQNEEETKLDEINEKPNRGVLTVHSSSDSDEEGIGELPTSSNKKEPIEAFKAEAANPLNEEDQDLPKIKSSLVAFAMDPHELPHREQLTKEEEPTKGNKSIVNSQSYQFAKSFAQSFFRKYVH